MDQLHINSDEMHRRENYLLKMMCKTLHKLKERFPEHIPTVVRNLFDNFEQLNSHVKIDPNELSTQIMELQPNEIMGVYVRKANCSLLFTKSPSSNEVTIAPFQVNLSNEQIYGDVQVVGGDINGDIQVKHTHQ